MALKLLKLALGIGVGVLCLFLAFRGVADTEQQTGIPWATLLDVIRSTSWWGYPVFFAIFLMTLLLRSERWRVQVKGLTGRAPGAYEALAINGVAAAAIFLLPFRLGELARPNISAQRGIMRGSSALAATALERAVDGLVTTGFFGILMLLMQGRPDIQLPAYIAVGGWTALAVFGGALVFFVIAFRWREGTTRFVHRMLSLLHGKLAARVASLMTGFLAGLACFRSARDVAVYLALTITYWLINAGSMFALLRAMHIDADPLAAFFVLCFLVIGMMIPAAPGNVGNFHVFARTALTVFGVAATPGVAYAIVLHGLTVISLVVVAGFFLATGAVSFALLRQATHSPPTTTPPAATPSAP